jgi:nucleoside-diphosphate-sugar epimerase
MKILMVGGTGNISSFVTEELLQRGHRVYHLNRGNKSAPEGVVTLKADINDKDQVESVLKGLSFDGVVDWLVYTPEQAERAIKIYRQRTAHYIFISSATVYQKPPSTPIITESTPLSNPFHSYARNKMACEDVFTHAFRAGQFPVTIIRPSHTYGKGWVPTPFGSADYTMARRILDEKQVIVPGDGQSLWTLTHARDFARALSGLIGNPLTLGEAFHITSDESLTWDAIVNLIGSYLGKKPRIVHIPTDFIYEKSEKFGPGIKGDKCYSVIFDNSKIKRFVPSWSAQISFATGVRQNLEELMPFEEHLIVQEETEREIERLLDLYQF